ncbi:MAG: hypothetical protein DMG84_23855 [Acidobacteria bacterium]|nr:MAG: hypothetical protein DMG84_23855 [Acidobacteriota bacterium]
MNSANTSKHSAAISVDGSLKGVSMPESGLVSVIIPCYNQAHFLHEAIESVLAQSYPNFEIIMVNDGSTDSTADVVRRYSPVRYVYQENAGLSSARNTGLKKSRGEYVVFLDADDRLLPEALQVGIDCLRDVDSFSRMACLCPSRSSAALRAIIIWNCFVEITFGVPAR